MKRILELTIFFSLQWVFSPALAQSSLYMHLHPNYDKVRINLIGFTAPEEQTIEQALVYLYYRIKDHWNDTRPVGANSRFEQCTAKYSTKDWIGWSDVSVAQNKLNNAYWTYTNFVLALNYHHRTSRAIEIHAMYQQNSVWGSGYIGSAPTGTNNAFLKISLNRYNLALASTRYNDWAGTIYHEFQHNLGLTHPTGYEGSLIKEAGLCVARNFENKSYGLVSTEEGSCGTP